MVLDNCGQHEAAQAQHRRAIALATEIGYAAQAVVVSSHLAHLQAVVADGIVIDRSRLAAFTAVPGLPQADRLCAHCQGHCCQHGLGWHAFMDLRSLQRWVDTQCGATLADAVAHFMAQVPAEHADGGCLYQGAAGCVLPRDQRADICNGFACPSLQAVQQATLQDPQATVVALTVHALLEARIDVDRHPIGWALCDRLDALARSPAQRGRALQQRGWFALNRGELAQALQAAQALRWAHRMQSRPRWCSCSPGNPCKCR